MDTYKKSKVKSIVCWIIAFALAIFYLIVSFLPFIFMVLNSFKEKFEMWKIFSEQCYRTCDFLDFAAVYCFLCVISSGKIPV